MNEAVKDKLQADKPTNDLKKPDTPNLAGVYNVTVTLVASDEYDIEGIARYCKKMAFPPSSAILEAKLKGVELVSVVPLRQSPKDINANKMINPQVAKQKEQSNK